MADENKAGRGSRRTYKDAGVFMETSKTRKTITCFFQYFLGTSESAQVCL